MKTKLISMGLRLLGAVCVLAGVTTSESLAQVCPSFANPTMDAYVTAYPNYTGVPPHVFPNPDAHFAVSVPSGQPLVPGLYSAWCVDASTSITAAFQTVPGTLYTGNLVPVCDLAALATLPTHGGTPPVGPPPITTLETWHKVNYILNHKAGYYFWDVQVAINRLVGGPAPNDPLFPPDPHFPPATAAGVNALMADVNANAANWTPGCGDKIGIIFNIEFNWDTLDGDAQLLILEVPFLCVTCPSACGFLDVPYSSSVTVSGGTSPYNFTIVTGGLPPGLSIDNATGLISGTPTAIGTYPYTVKVTDSGSPTGVGYTSCSITIYPPVTVNSGKVCSGESITLTAVAPSGSLVWSTGETSNSINVSPTTSTDYSVTLTTPEGCTYTAKAHVEVFPKPTIRVNDTAVCTGESATLTAIATGGEITWPDGTHAATYTITPTGNVDVEVTVANEGGCSAKAVGHIKVYPKPSVTVNDVKLCGPGTATFTAVATGGSIEWSTGATTASITVNVTGDAEYKVKVTSPGGCTAEAIAHVKVYPQPEVTVNSETICVGDSVTLTAAVAPSGSYTYSWSPGGATTQSITVSPSATTVYTVTVTGLGGCTDTATGKVTVSPGDCVPGAFNFAGSSATTGPSNMKTYNAGNGVSVKVTGFSRDSAGTWKPAYVGAYSGGLGITDVNEDGSAPNHTVDNSGNKNYLLFEFSAPVVINAATLGYVTTDSDLSLRIGMFSDPYNNHLVLSDAVLTSFAYGEENAGSSSLRTATLNASGMIGNAVIIAASLLETAGNDFFKVQSLQFCRPTCVEPVKVGDFVWNDLNKNGLQDAGEPGINGVKLTLNGTQTGGGTVTLSTTTAGNGGYLFAGLMPGAYTVTVDASNFAAGGALAGFTASPTLVGANRAVDSNPTPTGTTPVTLASGGSDLTLDFGYYLSPPPPPPCVASTFDFTGSTATYGTAGNVKTYLLNGIGVRASAWSRDRTTGAWAKAYLGAYGGGLGVTDTAEGSGANNEHTVDNVNGRDNFILFEFSQSVTVNRAYLGYVVNDSDMFIALGNKSGAFATPQTLSDAYFTGLTSEENNTGSTTARWADFNAAEVAGNVLIVAASLSDTTPEDYFKVQKLDICSPQNPPPPPPDCVTSQYNFTGSTATYGTAGNVRAYTVNGVGVKVSAFSRTTAGVWNTAYLGAYGGGLGVTDGSEGSGSNNEHTVDNVGRMNFVMFEFSQPVTVNRAFLGYVVGDSDVSVWIGNASNPYVNHLTLSDALLGTFGPREDNDTTLTTTRWADFNVVEETGNVLIIAASVSDDTPDDRFKIEKLEICANSATQCPSPWQWKDIGCQVGGYSSCVSGKYTVKGSGADIWGSTDGCRYVYQQASGDCTIIARCTSVQNTDLWAKCGVMIRESCDPTARHASVFCTPGNGVAYQSRSATGGSTSNANLGGVIAPCWIKIVRTGSTFTGYYSVNGTSWTSLGSQTISMPTTCYIGLAVTSHNAAVLCTGTFDNVTVTP